MITRDPSNSPLVAHRHTTSHQASIETKNTESISNPLIKTVTSMPDEESQVKKGFFSRYHVESPNFAHGSYGQISTAKDDLGKKVVIKAIPSKVNRKWIENEVQSGIRLSGHKNIVQLKEALHTSSMNYLVFDYIKGVELFQYMESSDFKPIDEKVVKYMFTQMINAISFSHSKGIAHRDLKLENVMVDAHFNIFVIDFGLSSISKESGENQTVTEYVGSENYLAPEVMKRTPYNPFKADVWSLGIILFAMLFGRFPWDDAWKVLKSGEPFRLRFPRHVPVSDAAKTLLVNMLQSSASKRISVEDILKDEWLRRSEV